MIAALAADQQGAGFNAFTGTDWTDSAVSGNVCTLTMDKVRSAGVTFTRIYALNVSTTGAGVRPAASSDSA